MKKTVLLSLAAISMSAVFVGCESTANTNANLRTNGNTNTAVVVNSNSTATTNTTTNSNKALTREEYEKDKDSYSKQAKDAGDKIGQSADDLWLWTKAKAALATVDGLRDSTVNVDVENAVVTLRGTVATAAQKDAAVKAAKVEGVTSVKDMLKVDAKDSMTNQMTSSNSDGNTSKTANSNANMKK